MKHIKKVFVIDQTGE
ncbi:hypothetical protein LSH36_237g01031 [Paralvinella palmiformis]|uniref:Uncharacterized protein n=1 Tax=Paralvinella palmiformis TaxID=53620 RepID=A0AAD9N5A1_9ANNE|nr:hypothetical protein LSH36_237g01031 [Paralvinella palmiformis]